MAGVAQQTSVSPANQVAVASPVRKHSSNYPLSPKLIEDNKGLSRPTCTKQQGRLAGVIALIALIVIAIVAIVLVSVYAPVLAVGLVIAIKVAASVAIVGGVAGYIAIALNSARENNGSIDDGQEDESVEGSP